MGSTKEMIVMLILVHGCPGRTTLSRSMLAIDSSHWPNIFSCMYSIMSVWSNRMIENVCTFMQPIIPLTGTIFALLRSLHSQCTRSGYQRQGQVTPVTMECNNLPLPLLPASGTTLFTSKGDNLTLYIIRQIRRAIRIAQFVTRNQFTENHINCDSTAVTSFVKYLWWRFS